MANAKNVTAAKPKVGGAVHRPLPALPATRLGKGVCAAA